MPIVNPEPNPGLQRVHYSLRATGVRDQSKNELRTGIHTRGYLPHVKREGACYFVTFRLRDSLPREILMRYKQEQAEALRKSVGKPRSAMEEINVEYQRKIERYLDRGAGVCYLRRPQVADAVTEAILFGHKRDYLLEEWVVMPNHVHLLVWPLPNKTLSGILRDRKRRAAREANKILRRTGEDFWQHESYDHWIRNEEQKARVRSYIRSNPVKCGLCRTPEEWQWSSAFRK